MEEFNRITRNPAVMGGKACIRGMRVTVGMILGQIAEGATPEDLLREFPYLEREDVTQCQRDVPLQKVGCTKNGAVALYT
jgi:uncharacterized protein (DUF433 family)